MANSNGAKLCDLCGKNEATMRVSQLDKDGNASEIAVCAECARERGLSQVEVLKVSAASLLEELKGRVEGGDKRAVCSRCGLSFADFKRLGRFGCAGCYSAFREELVPILRRLHGAVQHVGKTTSAGRKYAQEKMEVERLREELRKAIAGEDYERAAALRDQLRQAGHEVEQ
jgi:protein arginine kinase activator